MVSVSARKAWLVYSLVRLGLFAGAMVILWLLLGNQWLWLAAILAAIISASISIIWLDPIRQRAAESVQEWRDRKHTDDDLYEDDVVESDPSVLDVRPEN